MKLFLALVFSLLLFGSSPDAKDLPHYTKNELIGNFEPTSNRNFDKVKSRYTNRGNAYLRDEVYDAFKDMWKAAKEDGVNLVIISATRNKNYQTGIWNRKWQSFGGPEETRVERILQYSAMPGTSRHHWGTDFDLNALENSYFEEGEGLKIYQWLSANAHRYGFFQPYTAFNAFRDVGYRLEKWHWSYYPTAKKMQRAYSFLVDYQDLTGFNGSEWAQEKEVINNYVLGIEVPPTLLKP